jgi:XTP/dITP diphosphohydrolase
LLLRLAGTKVVPFYLFASVLKEKKEKNISILICTSNKGKIKEFKNNLLNMDFFTLKDENIFIDIEETGQTFLENALIKLNTLLDFYPYLKDKYDYIIAEDSGLCVSSLRGEPGIYSARYSGTHGNDLANNNKLLSKMVGTLDRSAYYEIHIALYHDSIHTFSATMNGSISTSIKGDNGFGYDPIFIPENYTQTLGELTEDIKASISHRSKAILDIQKMFL